MASEPTLIRKRGIETLRTLANTEDDGRVMVTHYGDSDPDECVADLNLSLAEARNLREQLDFQLPEYRHA